MPVSNDVPDQKLIVFSAAWRICNSMLPPSSNRTFQEHPLLAASTSHDHATSIILRRTQTGPALFTVQDTKLGRQTSIIHVSLSQPKSNNAKSPFAAADLREEVVGTSQTATSPQRKALHSTQAMSFRPRLHQSTSPYCAKTKTRIGPDNSPCPSPPSEKHPRKCNSTSHGRGRPCAA